MTRPNLVVRPATPSDAPALARSRFGFRASLGAAVEAESAFVARCTQWMRERLAAGGPWRCWLVEHEGAVAGHLWLQLIEKVPNPMVELESHAYITNVHVDAALRAQSLGSQLMQAAMAFCREQRVDSVILWPTPRSRSLYARHGFAARHDIMEAVLDPGRDLSHGRSESTER